MRKPLLYHHVNVVLIASTLLLLTLNSCKKEPSFHENPISFRFSERSKLEWTDFKGYYSYTEEYAAAACSGVFLDYVERIENGKLVIDFDIYGAFYQECSWTKYREGKPNLLEHEQLHFYITELQARKMRKHFQEFNFTGNYEEEIHSEYCYRQAFLTVMQDEYDTQSNHSLVVEEQQRWEKKVANEMATMGSYSVEKFTVKTNVPMTQGELDFKKSGILQE